MALDKISGETAFSIRITDEFHPLFNKKEVTEMAFYTVIVDGDKAYWRFQRTGVPDSPILAVGDLKTKMLHGLFLLKQGSLFLLSTAIMNVVPQKKEKFSQILPVTMAGCSLQRSTTNLLQSLKHSLSTFQRVLLQMLMNLPP